MSGLQINTFLEPPGDLPEPMAHSDARGKRLLAHGRFGADLIRFPAGGRVGEHTHPGGHMLFVVSGEGWVVCRGERARLAPGLCYFVPGLAPHAIEAASELTLLAVADDHRDVSSQERLDVAR